MPPPTCRRGGRPPRWRRRRVALAAGSSAVASTAFEVAEAMIDAVLEHVRRPEHQHLPRQDRDLLAGLGIAPDAPALAAHRKAAERRDLDHLTAGQRIGNFTQHGFDQIGRLVPGQADFLVHRFAQLGARDRGLGHATLPQFRSYRSFRDEMRQLQRDGSRPYTDLWTNLW